MAKHPAEPDLADAQAAAAAFAAAALPTVNQPAQSRPGGVIGAGAPPYHLIRLDRSRAHSMVSGECLPDDPHYGVAFVQDGLPFDAQGKLVPPNDSHTGAWKAKTADGKETVHQPLYDDRRRGLLAKRLERIGKSAHKPVQRAPVAEYDADSEDVFSEEVELVNLEEWLRGNEEYEPMVIFATLRKRESRNFNRLRDAIDFLVHEKHVVHAKEVHRRWMDLLDRAA